MLIRNLKHFLTIHQFFRQFSWGYSVLLPLSIHIHQFFVLRCHEHRQGWKKSQNIDGISSKFHISVVTKAKHRQWWQYFVKISYFNRYQSKTLTMMKFFFGDFPLKFWISIVIKAKQCGEILIWWSFNTYQFFINFYYRGL